MTGRESRTTGLWYALWSLVIGAAVAQPALGVGLLQVLDLEILQGGNSLFSKSGIWTGATKWRDGSTPIDVGTASTGAHVWATIKIDAVDLDDVDDRNFYITINGKDGNGDPASLFAPDDEGTIAIRMTNMLYTRPDAADRPEPWDVDEYKTSYLDLDQQPLIYMQNTPAGFLGLPSATEFLPTDYQTSMQVRKSVWRNNGDPAIYEYGFAKLNSGLKTGFELTNIPDVSGEGVAHTGAPQLFPVVGDGFDDPIVQDVASTDWGFVDEIGIVLNMRDVPVPEPATALMVLMAAPLAWRRRRRR